MPRVAVSRSLLLVFLVALPWTPSPHAAPQQGTPQAASRQPGIPRTADGKPNLQGIWRVRGAVAADLLGDANQPASRRIVEGGEIPYQPWAATRKAENFKNRKTADPLANCYLPGVPRIMYLDYPFHIFQTRDAVAITFEWSQVFRLIHTNGSAPVNGIEFWMGDSRGRWDGDTLVVNVTNHNDRTWFDAAGNFHSEAMKLVERFTLADANTLRYEATVEDPKVFTRPWKITVPLQRQSADRIFEYQCQAEAEEASGAFERNPRTWYPKK